MGGTCLGQTVVRDGVSMGMGGGGGAQSAWDVHVTSNQRIIYVDFGRSLFYT